MNACVRSKAIEHSHQIIQDVIEKSESGGGFRAAIATLAEHISRTKHNLEIVLNIENELVARWLKRFETEDAYEEFFGLFNNFYKDEQVLSAFDSVDVGDIKYDTVFFVHNGTMVAHVQAMINQIRVDRNRLGRVGVLVIQADTQFVAVASSLDIEVIQAPATTWVDIIRVVAEVGSCTGCFVWMCSPVFLSVVSKLTNNVVWWSLKFHPTIDGVKRRIGCFPSSERTVIFKNVRWDNRTSSFKRCDKPKIDVTRAIGAHKFGAFCREELIDFEDYWNLVAIILKANSGLYFTYCGRQPIHDKWVNKLGIEPTRITYLGWLDQAERAIINYKFLLNPLSMSHGHLGLESMVTSIPVLASAKQVFTKKTNGYITGLMSLEKGRVKTIEKKYRLTLMDLFFVDEHDLLVKVAKLVSQPDHRESIQGFVRELGSAVEEIASIDFAGNQ